MCVAVHSSFAFFPGRGGRCARGVSPCEFANGGKRSFGATGGSCPKQGDIPSSMAIFSPVPCAFFLSVPQWLSFPRTARAARSWFDFFFQRKNVLTLANVASVASPQGVVNDD